MSDTFLRDDYEAPSERPCSPKLIRGILTDGIQEDGEYQMTLARQQYRMEWPMRGLVLLDGKYIGDWEAGTGNRLAVLSKVRLTQGRHRLTLISACTYGVWPESIEVVKRR